MAGATESTDQSPDSLDAGLTAPVLGSALAAGLSSLNYGWCLGEPNIHEGIIKDCVEGEQTLVNGLPTCLPMGSTVWGVVVGLVALGALVGSLAAGQAADRFGRKTTLLVNNVFFVAGAILLGTATTTAQLAVGRFVSGIGCGVSSTVVPTYNSECSPKRVRGSIGAVLQLSVEIGIFLSQVIAITLAAVPNWRILFSLSAAISLIQLLWLPFMPESPCFLAKQGRIADAGRALQALRPGHDISRELQMMASTNAADLQGSADGFTSDSGDGGKHTVLEDKPEVSSMQQEPPPESKPTIPLLDILRGRTPDVIWHPLFCTLFLMGFQQWSGSKGIVFYSTDIMENVFHMSTSQIQHIPNSAQWVTIGIAGMGVAAVAMSMALMDRLGRRRLLIISTGGLVVACILIVVGCVFNISVLAVISVFSFKLAYGLGLAPIPWLSASEMLPYYALGPLSGIASALNWMMIFVIGLLFPTLSKGLGDYLFLPFAVLNGIAFIVVLLFVPETKGLQSSDVLYQHGRGIHVVWSVMRPSRKVQAQDASSLGFKNTPLNV